MLGISTANNQPEARIGMLPAIALALMLGLAGALLLLAVFPQVASGVHEAEADTLLRTLEQASARCTTTPSGPAL